MFEKIIERLLVKYFGDYLEDLDKTKIRLKLF